MNTKMLPKWAFYLLSFTWGIVMTLIGCAAAGILLLMGHRPQKNCYGWVFEVGQRWGGVSFGPIAVVQKGASQYIKDHEFGHAVQNCYFGFLFPFVIALPSGLRYQYRTYKERKDPTIALPNYYSIWFERTASEAGEFYRKGMV